MVVSDGISEVERIIKQGITPADVVSSDAQTFIDNRHIGANVSGKASHILLSDVVLVGVEAFTREPSQLKKELIRVAPRGTIGIVEYNFACHDARKYDHEDNYATGDALVLKTHYQPPQKP